MAVVIVESPAKAKTINKYLGSAYKVLASYGHVRDLNDKRGSVDPDNKFSMKWQINPKSAKHISDIKLALAGDNHLNNYRSARPTSKHLTCIPTPTRTFCFVLPLQPPI